MIYDSRDLLLEYIRRERQKNFSIRKLCFDKQRDFLLDPNRFKLAYCSRRSGKTYGCGADLLDTCTTVAGAQVLYITLSRLSAKKIIWRQLLELNEVYKLGGIPKLGDLSISFPHNNSILYLSGAKDSSDIEKFRGMNLHKVYIDEAQSFKSYLIDLIEDILEPCLWDYQGTLSLIGTPNSACKGTFFEACHNKGIFKNWSVHKWNIIDNTELPFLKEGLTIEQFMQNELTRKNIDPSDPSYQRETLGRWVRSEDSLVFHLDSNNLYDNAPPICEDYIMGCDIGFNDHDSIVILGWKDGIIYVVDEWHKSQITISEFAKEIRRMDEKWKPIKKVIDSGALGKKITEEIRVRFGINLIAAEKQRKYEFIELVNSDLKQNVIKLRKDSEVVQELELLQYDSKGKIDERFTDDLVDSFLYAYREARHFSYIEPPELFKVGTKEWGLRQEKIIENELEDKLSQEQKQDEWGFNY